MEKNTDKKAIQSFTVPRVSGASERANGRASGPVLQSVFLAVIDHSGVLQMKGQGNKQIDSGTEGREELTFVW